MVILIVHGNWGTWSAYDDCSKACGGGTQRRSRVCDNPPPSNSGASCEGSATEEQDCGTAACPGNV